MAFKEKRISSKQPNCNVFSSFFCAKLFFFQKEWREENCISEMGKKFYHSISMAKKAESFKNCSKNYFLARGFLALLSAFLAIKANMAGVGLAIPLAFSLPLAFLTGDFLGDFLGVFLGDF